MGLPNISDMFCSEQDFHSRNCNFFPVKSSTGASREESQVKSAIFGKEKEVKRAFSSKIEVSLLPAAARVIRVEEEEDGCCKTPSALKSEDHNKIPLKCPPAPRKPKSLPSEKRSRKDQTVLLDLSHEIESLFPPALLKDLLSGKIKKARRENTGIM